MRLTALQPAVALLLISAAVAPAATEGKLNHRFLVQPGGTVVVEVDFGSINVSTNSSSEVVVDVWRKISRRKPPELSDTMKLATGGGGISVSVPGTAAFNLDARTSGGGVSTDFPVTVAGKIEQGRLQGPVNGGGKSVELRSGGGSIHLKKLE